MTAYATTDSPRPDLTRLAIKVSATALVAITWISGAIFGIYILASYGGALQDGDMERWNQVLPKLYEAGKPAATTGIGAHFAAGALILVLGPIQLVGAVRRNAPALHRWLGRAYVAAAFLAGVGGLAFIMLQGTIGGWPMNIGFAIYGGLMVLAAVETIRHAMARRIEVHRAWAIRLFALAIGSWLYRLYYGFWELIAGSAGHTPTFDGPFDYVMDFFFFVPNLIIAELFIRTRQDQGGPGMRAAAASGLVIATGLVGVATYFFTVYAWAPAILARF